MCQFLILLRTQNRTCTKTASNVQSFNEVAENTSEEIKERKNFNKLEQKSLKWTKMDLISIQGQDIANVASMPLGNEKGSKGDIKRRRQSLGG